MSFRSKLRWWFGFKPIPISKVTPNVSVSVIVPAYNEANSIATTIESILAQTYPVEKILIVDDCSADKTFAIASKYAEAHPQLSVTRTHKNQGSKATAQNYVLPLVTTDLFVTIDGDTKLAPDAIEKTLYLFNNPNTVVVCGFVVPQRLNTLWERGRLIEYLYSFAVMKPAQDHLRTVVVASGCFSVFRTKVARDEFGGFKMRTIAEDLDLTWEITAGGYDVYFVPRAVCYAVDPKNSREMFRQLERWYRGYFQSILVRGNLFRHSKRLALVVYTYLLWYGLSPFLIPLSVWAMTSSVLTAVMFTVAGSLLFTGIPSFIQAWKMRDMQGKRLLWKAITSYPAFFVVSYMNLGVFMYAFYKEFIRRDRLEVFKKGHS